ncbi:MAG: serine/threonine protein kinase [Acidobacteria bacterium]|nr:serine/threonine protein kinase [Acidobacteriota bacterium]
MPPPLNPERWRRLQDVFGEVVEQGADVQQAAIAREAATDPELAAQLAKMLAHEGAAAGRLREVIDRGVEAVVAPDDAPRRFGVYVTVREVGRGGMGVVYEAVGDDEFHRRVAIKVAPWAGTRLDARFRLERQILAGLDHPGIARFLDGGTAYGQPYFVMEFVDGVPLTTYCREHDLSVRDRLGLVRRVCAALDYAHQHLVVHRDLKPSNILVAADGTPKVLDFGIAKLLDPAAESGATLGVSAWTPDFASPEQVQGRPVSTRSDVYSLGLVLYEVLTGESGQRADTTSPASLTRTVCDEEPAPPSVRAAAAGYALLARELRGDLDTIVATAIQKEPDRRYASMAAFADDLGRYLDGLPVAARPSTWTYRASKLVARHRVAAVAAVLVAASIAGGTTAAVYQARRAERRFDQVRGLANAFVFDVHDRIASLPGATEARRAIVQTALTYLENLREDAAGDAALARELAAAYERIGAVQGHPLSSNLGEPEAALVSYARAEALLAPFESGGDEETLLRVASVSLRRAQVLRARGDLPGATVAFERARAVGERALGRTDSREAMSLVGEVYAELARTGMELRDRSAEAAAARAMELAERLLARDPADAALRQNLGSALNALGAARLGAGRLEEAASSFARAVEVRETLVRDRPGDVEFRRALMVSYGSLGDIQGYRPGENLGDVAGATAAFERTVALARTTAADDPADRRARFDLVNALLRLGALLTEASDGTASALAHLDEADHLNRQLLAEEPESDRYGYLQLALDRRIARVLATLGRRSDAVTRLERVRAGAPRLLKGPNAVNARTQMLMAGVDLTALVARAGDGTAALLAQQVAAEIEHAPLAPPALAAPVYGTLARAFLDIADRQVAGARQASIEQSRMWLDKSVDLWATAALPPALEPQRAAALRAAVADRARTERLARP